MQSFREEMPTEDSDAHGNRCPKVCGLLSLVVASLFFFGNITIIVWLFENNYPVKFSVICFMVATGVLYLTSFTSSLLLVTRKASGNQYTRTNSEESQANGFAQHDENQGAYEMTANVSYSGEPNVLQLPPKPFVRKTPPPPYNASGRGPKTREHFATGSEMDDSQLRTRNPDLIGMTTNGVYFEVEEHRIERNEKSAMKQCGMIDGYELETQRARDSVASLNRSPTGSNGLRLQRAGNSQLLLQQTRGEFTIGLPQSCFGDQQRGFHEGSISSERSPRSSRAVIRNPSTALKRKLKTEMSKSDLDSETRTGTSAMNSNAGMPMPHSNFNRDGTSQISQHSCNARVESRLNLSPETTPRFLRRGEVRSSQMNLREPIIPRTSHSSLNMERIFPNSNPERKKHDSLSNLKTERQQFASKKNCLIPEERQIASNSNLNADHKSVFLPTERRFSSHSNLKPEIQSNFVPAERQFAFQSNLNAEQHSNSETSHPPDDQKFTHSSVSPANSRSDIPDNGSTSQVKNIKIFQPDQFVVRSNDMPGLHKARSHGSLVVESSKSPQKLRNGEASRLDDASFSERKTYGTGRSIESGLDETRNSKQLTPQEWMSAWDKGIHKICSANGDKIVGVRI